MLARAVRGACSERRADRRHREAARGRRQSQLLRSRNAAVNANALGRKQRSCERHREACRAGCQVCVPASRGPSFPSPCARPSALRCGGGVCATCCPRVRDTAPTRAHLCRRTRTHARTHACMHARTHARTHACKHTHTQTHTHTHTARTHVHTHVHTQCVSDESTRMDSTAPCSQLGVRGLRRKAARLGCRPLRAVREWEDTHGGMNPKP